MLDILQDSTKDYLPIGDSLELDRIKDKIRSIWKQILITQHEAEDTTTPLEDYLKDNALFFPNEDRPENEVDELVEMLDGLFDSKEELEPIKSEGKAPDYKGESLSENKEGSKVDKTTYEVAHKMSKTPNDSKSSIKNSGYDKPTEGTEPKSKKHEHSEAEIKSMLELLEVERKRLMKVMLRRNREFGVQV